MRNAFDVLAAGAKAGAKSSNKTPQHTQPRDKGLYTDCPLCQRTVPLAFADAHVSVCLATPRQPQLPHPGAPSTAGRRAPSTDPEQLQPQAGSEPQRAQAAAREERRQQQYKQPEQPVLVSLATQQETPAAVRGQESESMQGEQPRNLGLELSVPASTGRGELSTPHPPQLERQATPQPTQHALTTQSAPTSTQAAAPSAFDIMRQSQLRAASRCQTFFLERTQDGRWLGHCWAKGCATAEQQQLAHSSCWTASVSVATGGRGRAGGAGVGGGSSEGGSGKESLVLLTNVPPGHGGDVTWATAGLPSNALPPEGRWRGGPSGLKSALQKAVRLCRGSCAVRAALHLAKDDAGFFGYGVGGGGVGGGGPGGGGGGGGSRSGSGGGQQLLRRLSIICVEDAILHPGLPLCVWLMIAQSKGFVLGATHMDALLSLTYQLAAVPVRDGVTDPRDGDSDGDAGGGAGGPAQCPASLHEVDELRLPPAEACLLKCLLLRSSYGGMAGDVRMLRQFVGCWAARFRGAAAPPPALPSSDSPDDAQTILSPQQPQLSPQLPPCGTGMACRCSPHPGVPQPPPGAIANNSSGQGKPSSCQRSSPAQPGEFSCAGERRGEGVHHTPCEGPGICRADGERGGSAALRAPDAYFATRLQAEDGGSGCGTFMPASQLMAEAASEQLSLHRVTATATQARQQATQEQGTRAPAELRSGPSESLRGEAKSVVPRWHVLDRAAYHAAAEGSQTDGGGARSSKWLAYLCDLYDSVPVPVPLSSTATVGPLRRSDVPLSAIDFHVSDVLPQLMARPEVQAALAGSAAAAAVGGDAEDALKSAMWQFRSSKNAKSWVHTLSPCCRGAASAPASLSPSRCCRGAAPASSLTGRYCREHQALAEQLAEEERLRQALAALWSAAAPWADRYSVGYIARRFGPP